jgi:co-chaperonin GroES (HSP10)
LIKLYKKIQDVINLASLLLYFSIEDTDYLILKVDDILCVIE